MRIDRDLRARFAELDEVFIQPVSQGDPLVEDRVRARYGRALSDQGISDAAAMTFQREHGAIEVSRAHQADEANEGDQDGAAAGRG